VLIFWRLDILGWEGVGWGNSVLFDFYSIVKVLALPHIRHASLLDVILHFQKKELFGETLGEQSCSFVLVKH
jgi:hypothetical protein